MGTVGDYPTLNGYGDMVAMSVEQYEKLNFENEIFIKPKEANLKPDLQKSGTAMMK